MKGIVIACLIVFAFGFAGWIPESLVIDGQEHWVYAGTYYIDTDTNTFSLDLAGDEHILFASGTVKKDHKNRVKLIPDRVLLDGVEQDVQRGVFDKETYDFTFGNIEARYGNMEVQ